MRHVAESARFIEGIYNYCDKWCERCRFRDRCACFNMADMDIPEEVFWRNVNEMFDIAVDMAEECADGDFCGLPEEDRSPGEARNPTAGLADTLADYIRLVGDWFEENERLLVDREEELELKAEQGYRVSPDVEAFEDAVKVIQWYQVQIYIKTIRALKVRGGCGTLDGEFYHPDGSAKVALIGIDRSIEAWRTLYACVPERENEIIDILLFLDRLRRRIEGEFPRARAFVRPGFDEE